MRFSIVIVVSSLLLGPGCAWLQSDPHRRTPAKTTGAATNKQAPPPKATGDEPFAPTTSDSDLLFVRTGDRKYYYIIDRARERCFFHARLYGKKHLVPMNCTEIPEYSQLTGQDPPPDEQPMDEGAVEPEPEETGSAARESFERAWLQQFCAKRAGYEEPREVLLSRHGLTEEQWQAVEAEMRADKTAWTALQKRADETCPKGAN